MSKLTCPYCNSSDCQTEYDLTWKDERFAKYQVAKCQTCDVGFVLPLPTPAELDSLYNSLQYHDEDRSTSNYFEASQQEVDSVINKEALIIQKYVPFVPDSGRVLDIGAGWGTLLKYLSNQGYQTVGLEMSTATAKFATENLGLEIHNLPVEKIEEIPGDPFDLVIMKHTLEHFYRPDLVLKSVNKKLVDGGKLIIEVPNYGSYDRKKFGTAWPGFGPYHLWYFSKPSLQRFLQSNGFEILKYHEFMSETVFGGGNWFHRKARSVLNRLGGKNIWTGRNIGLIAQKIGQSKENENDDS